MKLTYNDVLKRDSIDIYMSLGDNQDWDVDIKEARFSWYLKLVEGSWGIDDFQYELGKMIIDVCIETVENDNHIQTDLIFEIQQSPKETSYVCRIYEEEFKDNKLVENEYASIPLKLKVEEKGITDMGKRAQVAVKYIEIDLQSDEKSITLTI